MVKWWKALLFIIYTLYIYIVVAVGYKDIH